MIRVVAWTGGLFALGCGVCQVFPGRFVEPAVLLVLGTTLFFVAGRGGAAARAELPARGAEGAEEAEGATRVVR